METLGDKIHKLRKREGLSQEELGFRVGVTRQTISQWEANALQPKSDKLKKLCEIFNVTSDYYLFNGQNSDGESDIEESKVVLNETALSENESVTGNNKSEEKPSEKKKFSKKMKLFLGIGISFLVLAVALIIIICSIPPAEGVGSVTSVSFNFDIKTILSILISIILIVAFILIIIAIIMNTRRKK